MRKHRLFFGIAIGIRIIAVHGPDGVAPGLNLACWQSRQLQLGTRRPVLAPLRGLCCSPSRAGMNALETSLLVVGIIAFVVAGLFLLGAFINPKALNLDGRVVVVTGGSSGIGLACAQVRTNCNLHGKGVPGNPPEKKRGLQRLCMTRKCDELAAESTNPFSRMLSVRRRPPARAPTWSWSLGSPRALPVRSGRWLRCGRSH